jgi:hypothetical protein
MFEPYVSAMFMKYSAIQGVFSVSDIGREP